MSLPPLRRLTSASDPAGEETLDLFEFLFPPEELEPREVIRAEWEGSPFETWVIEVEGKVGGLCRGRISPSGEWCWIVHFGLRPELRGRRWGAPLLLEGIKAITRGASLVKGTLLEVEREEDASSEEDRLVRQNRLSFFGRLGAVKLTSTYIQASVRPECPPVPLNLLWLPADADHPETDRLIQEFYQVAFDLSPDHPYLKSALGRIPLNEALETS